MKSINKITSIVLSFALFLTLFLSVGQVSQAASSASALKKAVPSKVRIMPYNEYSIANSTSTTAIFVPLASYDNCISNIKVSNSALKAKQTHEYKSETSDSVYPYYATIGLYAVKEGTYKVSFDVLTKKGGAKLYSKKVTVYVKSDSPFSSVKYAGKSCESYNIQTKSKGKLSIKMNKGYKLKSIEIGTYTRNTPVKSDNSRENYISTKTNQTSTLTYKKVKNNSVITLGTSSNYSYTYSLTKSEDYRYIYYYLNDRILAQTTVKITYVDKYSKQNCEAYYYLYRMAK